MVSSSSSYEDDPHRHFIINHTLSDSFLESNPRSGLKSLWDGLRLWDILRSLEQRFQVVESFIARANLREIMYSRDCEFAIQREGHLMH